MQDVLIAEMEKCKGARLWLPALLLPLLSACIGALTYQMNAPLLSGPRWQSLWVQTSLFYGYFFFPMMIAICASSLWRLEHRENNWNRMMTAPVPVFSLIAAKFIVLCAVTLLEHAFFVLLTLLCGKLVFGFQEAVPPDALAWALFGWLSALPIAAVQLYLSMRIRSFAAPVGLALASCVVGLGVFVVSKAIPYPNTVLIVGLGAQGERTADIVQCLRLLLTAAVYAGVSMAAATLRLRRIDIAA